MIALGIIFIIIGVILLIFAAWADISERYGSSAIGWFAGGLFTLGVTILSLANTKDNTPTAIDVYQGNTTLQYTIVDSVKVDSVVVWKSKMD